MSSMVHRAALAAGVATAALACGTPARAQQNDVAAAEALFRQAKALFAAGDYAAACPKFAESQRIDRATGTLLALAACHELQGKTATAWAEFGEVEAASHREGRADRERAAHEHAMRLEQ